ncbi:hypothetical protein Ahy_B02g058703 [Arachis hypogaea]|uniref:Uncharacterized protein n=1 Tax=Arachis hypogaea TaxID=3818 RepID=A0A445AF71_ARAHY|nr:hypothetical protein Ahy_B02g058703 [Arachis hypogaea]
MLIYFYETKLPRPFAPDAPPAPWVAYWTRQMILEQISSEATEPLTQGSFTPSVNAASNTRKMCLNITRATPDSELQIVEFQQETRSQPLEVSPLALSLPSSVQEELIRDDFIYVSPQKETQQTSNNDYPPELEKQGVTVSFTSSVIEDLFKDDYVYEVSNEDPANEQQQQSQEPPVGQQSEKEAPVNVNNSPVKNQQHNNPNKKDLCPPEPKKQGVTGSLTSSIIEEFFKDDDVYEISDEEQSQEPLVARQSEQETLILSSFESAAQPREREDERPSFNFGISPPASQPSQPFESSVSQLKILKEAVVDAGVTAALKFAEATTSEPSLPTTEVYKTPEKKIKITNELIEKCYHWMTHAKQTKDGSNEYEPIFVLKHEALYEGLREYFMSLMPKEHVHGSVVSIHSMILNQIKVRRYQEQIYIVPLDIVNFMLGTHGESYTDKRTNKAYRFDIEQYAHHRQFLDKRKLASHLFMRVYAGAEPLMEDGLGVEAELKKKKKKKMNDEVNYVEVNPDP